MKNMAFKKSKNYQKYFMLVIDKISKLCDKKKKKKKIISEMAKRKYFLSFDVT